MYTASHIHSNLLHFLKDLAWNEKLQQFILSSASVAGQADLFIWCKRSTSIRRDFSFFHFSLFFSIQFAIFALPWYTASVYQVCVQAHCFQFLLGISPHRFISGRACSCKKDPCCLTHGLSWKMKFDLCLFLDKIDLEILFADVLNRKKRFPD